MIYYFYGDDIFAGRKALNQLLAEIRKKETNSRLVRIEKNNFSPDKLKNLTATPSLFGKKIIFLIEEFSSFSPPQKQFLIELFSQEKGEIIFWDKKETKSVSFLRSKFPAIKIRRFSQPKLIFKFLESITPGQPKDSLLLFQALSKNYPEEVILFFLKKHLRSLLLAQINPSLLEPLPRWRKNKLIHQAKKFSLARLKNLYQEVILLEYKNKTGNLPQGLNLALVNLLATV